MHSSVLLSTPHPPPPSPRGPWASTHPWCTCNPLAKNLIAKNFLNYSFIKVHYTMDISNNAPLINVQIK